MVNEKIFEVLDYSLEKLKKARYTFKDPGNQKIIYKPFFSSFSVRDMEVYSMYICNGGLITRDLNKDHVTPGRVEVRMGNYAAGGGRGSVDFVIPRDYNKTTALIELWQSSNDAFWECIDDLSCRNASAIGSKDRREKYTFFSKEDVHSFIAPEHKIDIDFSKLEFMLKDVSRSLLDDSLFSTSLAFKVNREGKYIVNSEGSKIFFDYMRYVVSLDVQAVDSAHNWIIPHSKTFYAVDAKLLPTRDQLMTAGEQLKKELFEKIKSPIQKNGTFPVIMDPMNHGVLWHEVIGHSLEGNSMQENHGLQYVGDSNSKISIFAGKIGHKVAPGFISVEDDPTIKDMDGYYPFDDEGVKAQKVSLIENGVLKNFLHSRSSAGFFKTKSNAHARSSGSYDPIARMSNLIIRSSNEVSLEQLQENLIKECERQNEPYGLMFIGSEGGLTVPKEAHFNTFPSKIFRVHRNGKMEQVRGIYVVGTPYTIMTNIIQTSDRYDQFRGICGSDSGWIPSVELAPDALIKSVEINRIPHESYPELKDPVIAKPKI